MLPNNGQTLPEIREIKLLVDKYAPFPHLITESYDFGGVALADASQGIFDYLWKSWTDGTTIYTQNKGHKETGAGAGSPTQLLTGQNITEVSLTFDQNARPVIAYVENGDAKLRWFDPKSGGYTTTDLPNARSPRVSLDDKRRERVGQSDVILSFIEGETLYAATQRERYTDRITIADDVSADWFLWRAGMNVGATYRWQVYAIECYEAWVAGLHEPASKNDITP